MTVVLCDWCGEDIEDGVRMLMGKDFHSTCLRRYIEWREGGKS
jgi:hypothetical protein